MTSLLGKIKENQKEQFNTKTKTAINLPTCANDCE